MPNRFNITPRAKTDLNSIWLYTLETWNEAQADKYVAEIYGRFAWLAKQPQLGKHRPDIEEGYYFFPQAQHLIVYLIHNDCIDIIGVPHRNMDIDNFFED